MAHVAKTLLNDRVNYHKDGKEYAAIIVKVHDDQPHVACLTYYCPDSKEWLHAEMVPFGQQTNAATPFFCNSED